MSNINNTIYQKISNYNLIDLIKINSSCFLIPGNVNKVIRLEMMANYIISNKYEEGKPSISKSNLRNVFKSQFKQIEWVEDPPEQMFSNTILFHGGNYVVLPGINENGTYILQNLLNGVFISGKLSKELEDAIFALSFFILKISDLMCQKANICSLMKVNGIESDVILPRTEIENNYKNAVSFDKQFISNLASQCGLSLQDLDELIVNFGDIKIDDYSNDNHPIQTKMFVDCRTEYVVINPANLLGLLRHLIISKAVYYKEETILAECFTNSVWDDVNKSLWFMNYSQSSLWEPNLEELPNLREQLFQIDTDKLAYVILITDDYSDYSIEEPYGTAGYDFLLINDHIKRTREKYKETFKEYREVFTIVILQQSGRALGVAFESYISESGVKLNAEDLKIFSSLEGSNSLALYYFSNLMERYNVITVNFLDAYGHFLNKNKTFYASDNIKTPMIVIFPGDCKEVVEDYYQDYNPHGVPSPVYDSLIEVVNFNQDRNIPIYSPVLDKIYYSGLFVERLTAGTWFVTNSNSNEEFRFVDTLAYWFWQFEELVSIILENKSITISVSLSENNNDEYFEIEEKYNNQIFNLTIYNNIDNLIATNTNIGERHLMEGILKSLNNSFGKNISEQLIQSSIEEIMPIGSKKKLLLFDSEISDVTLIEPGKFPTIRYVEPIIIENLLDELGQHLLVQGKYKIGEYYGNELLNDAVGYLFEKFEKLFRNLSNPIEALLDYMGRYENVIRKKEENKFTMITALHCFPNSNGLKYIEEQNQNLNQLSVSLRFIIEYLGTVNFNNDNEKDKKYSFSIFDESVAIVTQIIQIANNSDLIRYELTDLKVSILNSKRIGFSNRHLYENATMKYLSQNVIEILNSSKNHFNDYWIKKEIDGSRVNNFNLKIQTPFKDEFDVDYDSYIKFMNGLIDLSYKYKADVCLLPKEKVIKEITELTEIRLAEIEKLLNLSVLPKRNTFLKVKKPYTNNDVVPWKFNRELSYLRKPVIDVDGQLLWSKRHVYTVMYHLLALCTGGRLKANSQSMKEFISYFQNIDGENFNDNVYKLFNNDNLIVDKQVKKLGNKKIATEEGFDLGDIDVLVINPERKIILLLECKDLSVARNVYEISHELIDLYRGTDAKRSIVQKHFRRYEWIKNNISDLLEKYKLNQIKGKWHIKPLIILSEAMVTPHLVKEKNKVEVIPLSNLEDLINSGKIFRK